MFGAEEAAYRRGVEDGIRQEGERILQRIREAVASWEAETDERLRGMVQASLQLPSAPSAATVPDSVIA